VSPTEEVFFYVEGANVFISNNCWNICLVRKLLPANPPKRF